MHVPLSLRTGLGLRWPRQWLSLFKRHELAILPNCTRDPLELDRHHVTVAVAGPAGAEAMSLAL